MDNPCVCGDAGDEHDPQTKECLIDECPCFYYEEYFED